MAIQIFDDAIILIGDLDVSGQSNSVNMARPVEMKDRSVFGVGTRISKGGLFGGDFSAEGFVDLATGGLDEKLFAAQGLGLEPITVLPDGFVEGGVGYGFKAIIGEYNPGAAVGEIMNFTVTASMGSNLVRGIALAAEAAASASGSSTARQHGVVGATQKLYAALHVVEFTGTSLDVVVRSDDNAGMTTTTTRITFAQAAGVTSEWATPVSGAITDDYWDIDFTIVGGSASIKFVVLLAIQ